MDFLTLLQGGYKLSTVYKLIGEVNVPEEKRAEMNQNVLKLLNRCGIRKTEMITLGNKKYQVVRRVQADQDGIVRFDYSIFEKKIRNTAEYDTKTCRLVAPDPGGNEFGIVVHMINVLQEAYSEKDCYFTENGKPSKGVDVYVILINSILDTEIFLFSRLKVWDMYKFFRSNQEGKPLKGMETVRVSPYDLFLLDMDQFLAVAGIDQTEIKESEEGNHYTRDKISEYPPVLLNEYLYRVIKDCIEQHGVEKLTSYLSE